MLMDTTTSDNAFNIGNNWNLTTDQIQFILLRLGIITDDTYKPGSSLDINLSQTSRFMINKIDNLSVIEAITILREALAEHKDDFNFLHEDYQLLQRLVRLIPGRF